MADEHLKYLEFIQGAITRMASNSFTIKGWSVALGTAVLGYSVKESDWRIALFALVPTGCFWLMDGYYLGLERKFRDLWKAAPKAAPPAAAMVSFDMNPGRLCGAQWWAELRRPAVFMIHAPLMVLAGLVCSLLFVLKTVLPATHHS